MSDDMADSHIRKGQGEVMGFEIEECEVLAQNVEVSEDGSMAMIMLIVALPVDQDEMEDELQSIIRGEV